MGIFRTEIASEHNTSLTRDMMTFVWLTLNKLVPLAKF